ncbi:MAG: methylenetetrahydrofolate reductase [NAD(P)H] [Elusimicrobia bacterium GWA2_56_46]|nr:MAG: methylenetetrahydrofolate reductase [NAD(P)H] [Elusimicrobia bacterium GWA2_56_46]OGR56167.1 MAG: methylenetetrahydrofolate reductase [NAD(P)H] [Elusimicrobia bacterium GWC2_56_31]HBW23059.1 methylenetetrahydrofolate reductase [NAD(P)H] [Elusimicrobiota bacterium]
MKITERLKRPGKLFSFEFYPPKTEADSEKLFETVKELKALDPDFISITNSSTGAAPYRTVALSGVIKEKLGLEVMAHLTCIGHSREEIKAIAGRLKILGIENVLALRGDIHNIEGIPPKREYRYASELAADLKALGGFSIGGAGYPEKHPEAADFETDIKALKTKTEAGADFIITQLFFENRFYFEFVEKARKAGVAAPIIPGLMPLTSYKQLQNFSKLFSVFLPRVIKDGVEKYADDKESLLKFSVEYASRQAEELLKRGAPGIHFYTLNRSKATKEILKNIR